MTTNNVNWIKNLVIGLACATAVAVPLHTAAASAAAPQTNTAVMATTTAVTVRSLLVRDAHDDALKGVVQATGLTNNQGLPYSGKAGVFYGEERVGENIAKNGSFSTNVDIYPGLVGPNDCNVPLTLIYGPGQQFVQFYAPVKDCL